MRPARLVSPRAKGVALRATSSRKRAGRERTARKARARRVTARKVVLALLIVAVAGLGAVFGYRRLHDTHDNSPPSALDDYMRGGGITYSFPGDATSVRLPEAPKTDISTASVGGISVAIARATVRETTYEMDFSEYAAEVLRQGDPTTISQALERGSNDVANLWPEASEPKPGFHGKDQVENYLHNQVCGGSISLLDAQREIATNWLDVYQHLPQRVSATAVSTVAPAPVGVH